MNKLNVLKKTGIKKTAARTAILTLLKELKKPLSVSEIIKKLNQININVDRATIFRNINLLTKKELINKVEFNEGKFRYESSSLPHHHHLICTSCEKIKDIKSDLLHEEIEGITKLVSSLYGFVIEDHKVEFFGKCKSCRKN